MEQGGWLDQLLMAVLGFLNQQWLATGVALVGGAPVAFERELQTLLRVFGTGDKVELTWARGPHILRATGSL